jgi:hypothetical protein
MATKVKAPVSNIADKRFGECPQCAGQKLKECPDCGGWFPANIALGWLNCLVFHKELHHKG